jgi:hypothetical protein
VREASLRSLTQAHIGNQILDRHEEQIVPLGEFLEIRPILRTFTMRSRSRRLIEFCVSGTVRSTEGHSQNHPGNLRYVKSLFEFTT